MKINILGTDYEIKLLNEEEYPKLKAADAYGLAELYTKELIIDKSLSVPIHENEEVRHANLNELTRKIIRHEVIHAYFHEAGLSDYGDDEVLVDWLAIMLPKLSESSNHINKNFDDFIKGK